MAKKKKELTDAQKKFAEEYVIDWNGTRAYKAAYPSVSNDNTAAANASRLLRNAKVDSYITEIQKDLAKQAKVSALGIILELKKLVFLNIADLKKDWHSFKNWDDLTRDQKAAITELVTVSKLNSDGDVTTTVKVKLHDKLKSIEVLNRMLGFNQPDKLDLSSKIDVSTLTDEETEELIKKVILISEDLNDE